MARLPPVCPDDISRSDISTFFRLALWLLPQMIALAISALRVPLWARFPQPGEWLALAVMLAVQSAMAALMLPILDDWSTAGIFLLASWPMALIAGSLSATPIQQTIAGELYVSVWIVAIAVWSRVCGRRRNLACAVASCWSIGGALLLYLRTEFAPGNGPLSGALAGPLVASVQLSIGSAAWSAWLLPLGAAVVGIAVFRLIHGRNVRPDSSA
jgi:hypothetical protein